MARITVEDCIKQVPGRFDLVLLAAKRARDIAAGSSITVPRDNDKNPVIALREIAEDNVNLANLEEGIIRSLQRAILTDDTDIEIDEDLREVMRDASQWHKDEPLPKKFDDIDEEDFDTAER